MSRRISKALSGGEWMGQGECGGRGPVGRLKPDLGQQGWKRGWVQDILQWHKYQRLTLMGVENEE